ncbi:MAG: hypothetical protein K6A74_06170 [Lachnospiraceae bacterium]|nr:hypothetical protein [Lachnospiraceae bacterium]
MSGVLYIVMASLFGVALNLIRNTSADYATLFASVIVLYYLYMYQHMSRIDYMTGMMNRQTFYHFDKALTEADKAMYADKSRLKQAVLAAGGKLHRRAGDR